MGISAEVALAAANSYTEETVIGGGAIKGKNCIISSITEITGGHRVTFQWTLDDGTVQTGTMDVMDGQGGSGGTSDYSDLTNKPSINSVTLSGNKTTSDLNISYNDLSNKPTIPSLENCYQTTDSAGNALEDEDLIPYYNESVPGKSNMTWSGVKSTLKTYFDTIYSTITAITGLSDVNVSSPSDGQVLKYDSSSSKWVNANESGGGGGGISYSKTEQDTGLTWIDGKELYQKTIEAQFGTVTDGTWSVVDVQDSLPSNTEKAFIINGAMFNNTTVGGVPIPYYKDDFTRGIKAYINNGLVRVTTNWSQYSNAKVYITVQYTKASVS